MTRTFHTLDALTRGYQHIYLEPHLDDIALSCGGTVASQSTREEPVLVVTFFAGNPGPDHPLTPFALGMHKIWGDQTDMVAKRQAEQRAALNHLGADWLQLEWFDAIYRTDRYLNDDQLFGPIHPDDARVADEIGEILLALWRLYPEARPYTPLSVGNHVDHQLLLTASDVLRDRLAYEDFPYAAKPGKVQAATVRTGAFSGPTIDIAATIDRKIEAITYYQSQIGNLFGSDEVMRGSVRDFAATRGIKRPVERYWRLPD